MNVVVFGIEGKSSWIWRVMIVLVVCDLIVSFFLLRMVGRRVFEGLGVGCVG